MRRGTRILFALLLSAHAACRSAPSTPPPTPVFDPGAEGSGAADEPEPAPPWDEPGVERVASNAGSYLVEYRLAEEGFPLNRPFGLSVRVLDARTRSLVAGSAELSVAGWMPDHGHGLARPPAVRPGPDGRFDVEGLLFHMPGRWELFLDVGRGPLTERAEIAVDLE